MLNNKILFLPPLSRLQVYDNFIPSYRLAHERPEGMEEAAVIMTGLGGERIMQGLAILESQPRDSERLIRQVYDYSMPNVSDKMVRIIHSYTDYVNRVVWKKY